jgi:hypothetical protein
MSNNNPHPTIQVTGDKEAEFAKKLQLEADRQLAEIKPQEVLAGQDSVTTSISENPHKAFLDKIYMFPPSYNALRKELHEHWPEIWPLVAYHMAHNGPMFVQLMNEGTGLKVQFDSNKVEAICLRYLNFMRNKRGVSSLM